MIFCLFSCLDREVSVTDNFSDSYFLDSFFCFFCCCRGGVLFFFSLFLIFFFNHCFVFFTQVDQQWGLFKCTVSAWISHLFYHFKNHISIFRPNPTSPDPPGFINHVHERFTIRGSRVGMALACLLLINKMASFLRWRCVCPWNSYFFLFIWGTLF